MSDSTYTYDSLRAQILFDVRGWVVVGKVLAPAPGETKSHEFDVRSFARTVTGGGTGLGLIAAQTFLANGASRVYITGRRSETLETARANYNGPGEIVPFVGDVTKKEDIKALVAFVKQKGDTHVNLLINNAAVGGVKNDFFEKTTVKEISESLFSTTFEEWNTTLHLNTTAMFFMAAAFLPLLVAARNNFSTPGCIINVSSMSGITKQSQGGQFAYNASKAATVSLTQQLAYEFRKPELNVRVNTVAPGFFPSEMTPAKIFSPDPEIVRSQWGVPLGRIGNPKEYAQAVLALAADTYINGSVLLVDGGWLLQQS